MATDVIDLSSLDATGNDAQTADSSVDSSVQTQSSGENTVVNQDNQQGQANGTVSDANEGDLSGKAIRDAVRELSQASPAHAKILKQLADAHFRDGAWKQAFPTVQEATAAKQIIESAGGLDGISQAQTRIQAYDQQDAGLRDGNPEVLDPMFKDFPDGTATLAPHYLSKLEQANPQALASAVAPYAIGLLQQANVGGHLDAILAEKDPTRAMGMVQQLADWFKQQSTGVQQMRQGAQTKDPRAEKFKEQEQKLNQEREELFRGGVSERVNASVGTATAAVVDRFAKQYKLNDTQKAHYRKSLEQAVVEEMNGDKGYKTQVELRYSNKTRTHDTVASFIAGEFNRRVEAKAFDVAKSIYGAPRAGAQQAGTGVVKAGQPQTAPGGGPLKVSTRPADSQLDLNRPGADLMLIQGRGYLRDGRFVTWR